MTSARSMKGLSMNHFGAPCLNNYNNIVNRQKAYTLGQHDKRFILEKYFRELPQTNFAANYATNYANVPPDHESPPSIKAANHLSPSNHHHRQAMFTMGNNIDSAPPMPSSRQYSIVPTNNGYFKVAFPQTRTMTKNFQDPNTKLFIKAGEIISVLGPSKEDRSKFTICYKEQHIDVQHQYTLPLPIQTRY